MRFRLYPTPEQERVLIEHCAHARYVWNLALEQLNCYRPALGPTPGWVEQSRQLTEARSTTPWLAAGSREVQEKALRDFDRAVKDWGARRHGRPRWRRMGVNDAFRVADRGSMTVRRLGRRWATIHVPKAGNVRFRWTRDPGAPKSYRIKRDAAGRWWVAFAVIPAALDRGQGAVGVDRGVINTVALSDGRLLHGPADPALVARYKRLQRRIARQQKGSHRRERTKRAAAKIRARETDRVKDWIEKVTTDLVRSHDFIAVEALKIGNMTRKGRGKRGLNRAILEQRWGVFGRRLREKCDLAGVTLVQVNPAYTSRRCHACGHTARENRESQAAFLCQSCGHSANADVNAALNILAAGQAVTARGGVEVLASSKREPQLAAA